MLKRDRLWKGAILSSVLLILILADYLYLKAEHHLITESCLSMFRGGNFLSLDANQKTLWNPSCKLMHWKKLK
ncbi:hypothetical protein RvY_01922 [Ramazzottius varieornatus]|uniref:Uncharacterized protein n=1 Tax=Ramazzottius varieornatus TaxID=947166 RepID=A0A1D1ULT3_RAMVA|nr:hypothetical protein RvY_01922 [Ramazzottius varieornatus]